ncbi:MAG TPA: GNAT family N-acetyltransferase [Bacteroidia bacterium]|nr:GNAT family N-acetyltransferase [Bacteroidia bacterium]
MNPEFRLAQEHDLPAVNAFNTNQLPVWRHEFFSASKPLSSLAICEDGGKVVGTEGYVSYRLLQNGEPILSHRSERTLVSPDYRGKNLFQGMIDLCTTTAMAQGSLFCWGATAAQKAFERAGFHYKGGYRTYAVLPLSNTHYVFKHLMRGKAIPLNPLRLYRQLKGRDIKVSKEAITAAAQGRFFFRKLFRKRGKAPLEHLPAPRAWADVDALHARMQTSETLISLQHDQQLFDWLETEGKNRFLKVFSYEGNLLRSYLCIHLDERDSYAPVLDFCADSVESLAAAIAHVRPEMLHHGFSALFFTLNSENAEQCRILDHLKALGASRFGRVGTWVIKPLCLQASPLYESMKSWYLTDLWFTLYNRDKL